MLNPENGVVVKSPGRINLIGEHIDYNGGYVLPAAINLYVTLKIYKTNNTLCTVSSEHGGTLTFDIKQPLKASATQWENYILGVVDGLKKNDPDNWSDLIVISPANYPSELGLVLLQP